MNARRVLLLIISALFLIGCTGCDLTGNKASVDKNGDVRDTFKIYYQANDPITTKALDVYKEKYKDIYVDESCFSDFVEYKNKLTVDILSGEGPDVILLDDNTFGSINKLSSKGVLYDLNEYINKDKDFKMSDYYEKVLNSFEDGGKRFFIPLNYAANVLITSKESLKANNMKINTSNWTYNELLRLVREFAASRSDKSRCFFFNLDITDLMEGSGMSFIDFKQQKSSFDTKDFIEFLEAYKELYPFVCKRDVIKDMDIDELIKNNAYVMASVSSVSPASLSDWYSAYRNNGQEMGVYSFPAYKSGGIASTAYTGQAVAMNSHGKNKDAAYDFIKILISKDIQTSRTDSVIVLGPMPVNKMAYEEDFKYYTGKDAAKHFGASLPLEFKPQLDKLLSRIDRCEMIEGEVTKIIEEEMPDFLDGKRTAAQTAKAIDNKVNLYLNE